MLGNVARWTAATFGVAIAVVAAAWVAACCARRGHPSSARTLRPGLAFYVSWIVPNVVYVTLFQCIKPGYLLLSVPPVMILLACAATESCEAVAGRLGATSTALAAVVACLAGLLSTAVTRHHFRSFAFRRASLASVAEADSESRAILSLVEAGGRADAETMMIYFSWPWYGPTPQSLMLRHPRSAIAIWLPSGVIEEHRKGEVREDVGEGKPVPNEVRRIVWICESALQEHLSLSASFPESRLAYSGPLTAAFVTEVGDSPIDARVRYEDRALHLVRSSHEVWLP
jgi:hypothetical protein